MTLRNPAAHAYSAVDFTTFEECWAGAPAGFGPSDGDMLIDRNGHILLVEFKPTGKEPEGGQWRLLKAFAAAGHYAIVVWHGADQVPESIQMVHEGTPRRPCDLQGFKDILRAWFIRADTAHPPPIRQDTLATSEACHAAAMRAFEEFMAELHAEDEKLGLTEVKPKLEGDDSL